MSGFKLSSLLVLASACALPEPPAGPVAIEVVADAAPPRPDAPPQPDAAPVVPACPGVAGPGGACYFLSAPGLEGVAPWASATLDCAEQGGRLAVVTTADEQALLAASYCPGGLCEPLWLGLHDRTTEGTWVWIDGSPLGFSAWGPNEPNDAGQRGEDCAELTSQPVGGVLTPVWNDAVCVEPRRAICERS